MNQNKENSFKNKENPANGTRQEFSAADVERKENGDGNNFFKYVMVAVVALVIGFGVGRVENRKDETQISKNSGNPVASTSDSSISGSVVDENGSFINAPLAAKNILAIDDQPAGSMVLVKKIDAPKTVWLAINEDNGKGEPGNILGAQLFDPGTVSGSVELLRNTEPGKVYYAIIHGDNGDRAFMPKTDTPLLGADGKPIMITFKTLNGSGASSTSPAN